MVKYFKKRLNLFQRLLIFGIGVIIVSLVLSCGYAQFSGNAHLFPGTACDHDIFWINYSQLRNDFVFYATAIFSIILVVVVKRIAEIINLSFILFKVLKDLLRAVSCFVLIYDPVLRAFRKGIVHPQIYLIAL